MSQSNHRYPKRQRASRNQNQDDGPPPQLPPPPPQIVPPAGNNNNNNQGDIAGEPAAAGAAADAAAAPVVDPYAILAQQSNSDRPWVTALQNARNGIGQSISEAAINKGRVDLNSQRLFHIPQLGIFGKAQTRVAGGPIFLKCFYSSTFSGGTCPAIIRIPLQDGVPNYANFLNWIGSNAIGGDRARFHGNGCPCTNPNLHQQLNIQNHLMKDLNINAPASVVFPNIGNFGTSRIPWDCFELDLDALASLIGQSSTANITRDDMRNKNLKALMFKKWSSSLGVLFQAIVTSFTNGTLGNNLNDNLHVSLKKLLGSTTDYQTMYKNMPLELRPFAGLMSTKTKVLLWDPNDNSRIEGFNQGLEIKRDTLRLLFVLIYGFIKDLGVTIPLESVPIQLFTSDLQNSRQLLPVGDVLINTLLFRPNMPVLVGSVDLLGNDQASFLNLVGQYVSADQLIELQRGNFDAVPLPNMLQTLLLPGEESYRALAPNPNAGSCEVFYIMDIVNFFMRGAFTGVAPKESLASVLRKLLARGGACRIAKLLFKSQLRGVSGLCSYHDQGHDNETKWKAFFLLLERRAAFMVALDNGITETANEQEEEGAADHEVPELPPLGGVLTAENWVIDTCTETGLQFYYNTETQVGQWNLPEPGEQQA